MANCSGCGKYLDLPVWGTLLCIDCVRKAGRKRNATFSSRYEAQMKVMYEAFKEIEKINADVRAVISKDDYHHDPELWAAYSNTLRLFGSIMSDKPFHASFISLFGSLDDGYEFQLNRGMKWVRHLDKLLKARSRSKEK